MKKRILLVGICNSGSTAIGKCFLQRDDTHVLSQVIKEGVERDGVPNHAAFFRCQTDKPIIFNKEVFGWKTHELCTFKVLPDSTEFSLAGLIAFFLFRNPVAVWNGWVKRGWGLDINLFFGAYEHLYIIFLSALDLFGKNACSVVVFDKMHINQAEELKIMCKFADIKYKKKMLDWQIAWGKRRGGNTGNPDIDMYITFTKNLVMPMLTITQEVQDLITKRLGYIWLEVNKIAKER